MSATENRPANPPAPDLSHLITTFELQALIACGILENPVTHKMEADLEMAQYHIGILELLERKTAGNLTEEERRVLATALHEARIAFVEASKRPPKPRVAQATDPVPSEEPSQN